MGYGILAKDIPGFIELFDQSINPGLKLDTLYVSDRVEMALEYDGQIIQRQIRSICDNLKNNNGELNIKNKRLCKDIPGFTEIFNEELNPNIDINNEYSKSTKKIKILIDGEIIYRSIGWICTNLNNNNGVYKSKKINKKLAKDVEGFLELFDSKLNKNVDIGSLSISNPTEIYVRGKDGSIVKKSVKSICNNLKKHGGVYYVENEISYAKNVPGFLKIFDQSLNQDIDIDRLSEWDETTTIRIRFDNNEEISIETINLCKNLRKNNGEYIGRKGNSIKNTSSYAKGNTYFLDWFDEQLNPDIDLNTLLCSNAKTQIRYNYNGEIRSISASAFFKNIERNDGVFIPKKKNTNRRTKKQNGIHKRVKACNDPVFRKWFSSELNPDIDMNSIYKSDSKTKFYFENNDGVIDKISVKQFFRNVKLHNGEFVPRKLKTIPGINDAATLDPELILFWADNQQDLNRLSPYSGKSYNFVCPYCGHEFRKAMKNIALKSPKCAECSDTGMNKNKIEMPINVAFLLREWNDE